MTKEDITYAVVGIAVGLFLGFMVANTLTRNKAALPPPATTASQTQPDSGSSLPEGHPPIGGSQPVDAGPLPENAGSSTGAAPELPSLDALPASSKEKRAEQEYKNIQVLKGVPAERLTKIMFAFKDSLGVECTYCHIKDQFEKDDKTTKQIARKMIKRVLEINGDGLGGRVSCFTCHRGHAKPPA